MNNKCEDTLLSYDFPDNYFFLFILIAKIIAQLFLMYQKDQIKK